MVLYNCKQGNGRKGERNGERRNELSGIVKRYSRGKSNKKNLSNLGRKQRLARGKGKSKSPT